MASQSEHLGGLRAHSDAATALSGADSFNQHDDAAVESPFATDSQASFALAGEHSLPHAAHSTLHSSAPLVGNNSALSVTGFKGTVVASVSLIKDVLTVASTDASVQAREIMLKVLSVLHMHRPTRPRLSEACPMHLRVSIPLSSVDYHMYSRYSNIQLLVALCCQAKIKGCLLATVVVHSIVVSQEARTPSDVAAAVAGPPGHLQQSPYPHCKLASAQQRFAAAASVEAVQQDGDDDDIQGDLASNQVGVVVSSLPTSTSARRPKPTSLCGVPVPLARQKTPASHKTADRPGLEHGRSVMYDSEYQYNSASPASQQRSEDSHTQRSHKRHKADSGEALPAPWPSSALLLAPECSGASQGASQAASQQGMCQAAPETTQQATIEEVREFICCTAVIHCS